MTRLSFWLLDRKAWYGPGPPASWRGRVNMASEQVRLLSTFAANFAFYATVYSDFLIFFVESQIINTPQQPERLKLRRCAVCRSSFDTSSVIGATTTSLRCVFFLSFFFSARLCQNKSFYFELGSSRLRRFSSDHVWFCCVQNNTSL